MGRVDCFTLSLVLLAGACALTGVEGAEAATLTVTKAADTNDGVCNNDCSLREAIDVAADYDVIVFSGLFNTPQAIALVYGGLFINRGISIVGPGADLLTIASSAGFNGFLIFSNVNLAPVTLSGMTISGAGSTGIDSFATLTVDGCVITENGRAGIHNHGTMVVNNSTISYNTGGAGGVAGGIENHQVMTLTESTVSNNSADYSAVGGGGVFNDGFLTVVNSTISGNSKLGGNGNGGGIYHDGTTTIVNSTITGNSADGAGSASGVFKEYFSGVVTVGSSIVAANVDNAVKPDVVESSFGFASDGFNLIGNVGTAAGFANLGDQVGSGAAPLSPQLDPLGDYGGSTETHRLQATSPAIDKAFSFGYTSDQRGFTRPIDKSSVPNVTGGDGSDIGAYELHFTVIITGHVADLRGRPLRNAHVVVRAASGRRRVAKTDRSGAYVITNLPSNRTVQVGVSHPRYTFTPQVVRLTEEDVSDLNFTPLP